MRVALCMRGAISKQESFLRENALYNEGSYVDYKSCYHSIVKHIIQANHCSIDIFCQSWNPDLKDDLLQLYNPVKYNFEDNRRYNEEIKSFCEEPNEFGGISQALAMKKSIELKEEYEKENNIKYDVVILYRYDVLLWKDIVLSTYAMNEIYVNAHSDSNGDFHFIMNSENASEFKYLYDSVKLGNPCRTHFWIKNYVHHFMKKNLLMDQIVPGHHQEVLRKIYSFSINAGHLSMEQFLSYQHL